MTDRVTDRPRLLNGAACLLSLLADANANARGNTPDDEHRPPGTARHNDGVAYADDPEGYMQQHEAKLQPRDNLTFWLEQPMT